MNELQDYRLDTFRALRDRAMHIYLAERSYTRRYWLAVNVYAKLFVLCAEMEAA